METISIYLKEHRLFGGEFMDGSPSPDGYSHLSFCNKNYIKILGGHRRSR